MKTCINPACRAQIPPQNLFCGACGHSQAPQASPQVLAGSPKCQDCNAVIVGQERFCQQCGAMTPAAYAESLRTLRAQIVEFNEDGVIEDWELNELNKLSASLRVKEADYKRLLKEVGCFIGLPVGLALDTESCFLKAGSPTTLRVALLNKRGEDVGLLRKATLTYQCSTSRHVHSRDFRGAIAPGKQKQTTLTVDAPPSEGQYRLEGVIEAQFRDGRSFRGHFELPPLVAAARQSAQGPQALNIHVQGDGALVKQGNSLMNAAMTQSAGEFRVASGVWQPVEVNPLSSLDFDQWCLEVRHRVNPELSRQAAVVGEPQPCRAVLLRFQQLANHSGRGLIRDVWFHQGDVVTLGRDQSRADLLALVEPYEPPEQHPENVLASRRISSAHIEMQLKERGAVFRDLNSSNGTSADGAKVSPNTPLPISTGMEIDLAGSLTLCPEVFTGDDGRAHALHIRRVNNMPERSYALAPEGIGLWPSTNNILGPRRRGGRHAPAVLKWYRRGLCIHNHHLPGAARTTLGGASSRMGHGQQMTLRHLDRVQLGDQWLVLVLKVLEPSHSHS